MDDFDLEYESQHISDLQYQTSNTQKIQSYPVITDEHSHPTFEEVLKNTPNECIINIEIKYPTCYNNLIG